MPTLQRAATRFRPTVAVIDLDAIRHNVRALRPDRAQLMAVVKADGYGHGAVRVAEAAIEAGATWLGVALIEEGIALRDAGLDAPILVLSEFPPGSEGDALAAELTPTLYTSAGLERLAGAVRSGGTVVGAHVKVDTGMHRVGLPVDETVPFLRSVEAAGLRVEGLWTHLAKSEELPDPFTSIQIERFDRAAEAARRAGFRPTLHVANSGATMARPESHYDLVRVGVALYGLCPGPDLQPTAARLRPAMSWRSAVGMVKRVSAGERISYGQRYLVDHESSIATVPVGYADGYSRLMSGKARVLIRGRPYPVAGTITMDHLMVDCGDDPVEPGDEVVLIGRQGDAEVSADDLASWMGTINYEVVCGVSARVPREYVGGPGG
jgi:alanine racemase